jgi:hypothetical protein
MEELFDFIVARVLQHLGIEHAMGPVWRSGEIASASGSGSQSVTGTGSGSGAEAEAGGAGEGAGGRPAPGA